LHEDTRSWAGLVPTALLLVAGGGGDPHVPGTGSPKEAPTTKGTFAAVLSFGTDSSDIGTQAPATSLSGDLRTDVRHRPRLHGRPARLHREHAGDRRRRRHLSLGRRNSDVLGGQAQLGSLALTCARNNPFRPGCVSEAPHAISHCAAFARRQYMTRGDVYIR
jgi:hypothetical protein